MEETTQVDTSAQAGSLAKLDAEDMLAIASIGRATNFHEMAQICDQFSFGGEKVYTSFTNKFLELIGGDVTLLALYWVDFEQALPPSTCKACLVELIKRTDNLLSLYYASMATKDPHDYCVVIVQAMVDRCKAVRINNFLAFMARLDSLFQKPGSSLDEDLGKVKEWDVEREGMDELCRCLARRTIHNAIAKKLQEQDSQQKT
jgi:hypothetical protein